MIRTVGTAPEEYRDPPIHFLSGDLARTMTRSAGKVGVFPALIALSANYWREVVRAWPSDQAPLMIDSGVWTMLADAAHHQRADSFTDLCPEESRFWPTFRGRWIELMTSPELCRKVWGVVEIDGGTVEDKRKRREKLEDLTGRSPMPVYHTTDPLSYLVELLEGYDKICVSQSIYQPPRSHAIVEVCRWVDSPCWVHWLGASPDRPDTLTWAPHSTDNIWVNNFSRYAAVDFLMGIGNPRVGAENPPRRSDFGRRWFPGGSERYRNDYLLMSKSPAAHYAYRSLIAQRRALYGESVSPARLWAG